MKLIKLLGILFICLSLNTGLADGQNRKIEADFTKVLAPKSESYFKCIGAGRAAEGLRADWRRHLADVQNTFPFEYVRFHGLLHDDMGVCSTNPLNDNEIIYNFQYIDELYDYLLSVNIKPFVELSFMPSPLASGDKTVFWWKGNITPPNSYEAWAELIERLVNHLTKRYGEEEVESWYFEVWNEPNHPSFFSGNMEEYFKLYSVTAKTIKSINPNYRVGGPATAGNGWVEEIIKYCDENNVPLDFVSTHTYGVWGALDEFGVQQLKLVPYPNSVANAVNETRAKMNKKEGDSKRGAKYKRGRGHKGEAGSKSELELHYTEWSSSYSPRDLTHDTYLNAAYVLNSLRKIEDGAVNSMSYWTFTDVFEESGVPTTPLHGGFGLINQQGLHKPTYFAYKYLYQLGQDELVNDDLDSWVCKDEKGGIQVLAYNLTMPAYAKKDFNNTIFGKIREAREISDLEINLKNLPNGKYKIEIYRTGFEKNDIQTTYYKLGKPSILYPDQQKSLELVSSDKPELVDIIDITIGNYSETFSMRENDIYLIKLSPLF